jgi:hypothetical protein
LYRLLKNFMPDKKTIQKANADKRRGLSPGTQAGEFVRAEIDKIRKGEHGVRSAKQAIAIGLSEARRAGVDLNVPKKGSVPEASRMQAKNELEKQGQSKPVSQTRSRARIKALKKESGRAASQEALSKQAQSAARKHSPAERSATARKASETRARNRSDSK